MKRRAETKPACRYLATALLLLLGAFTGWLQVIEGFFLACVLGSLVGIVLICRRKGHYLPFGPYLAVACLFMILVPGGFQALPRFFRLTPGGWLGCARRLAFAPWCGCPAPQGGRDPGGTAT